MPEDGEPVRIVVETNVDLVARRAGIRVYVKIRWRYVSRRLIAASMVMEGCKIESVDRY